MIDDEEEEDDGKYTFIGLCQWQHGIRRGSAAARFLGLRVRIPPATWMSLCCDCCVLPGRGLCVGADHSSRGVLPSVVCLSVIVKSR